MKHAKVVLGKLLHPPAWVLWVIPPAAFSALGFIFAAERTESAPAYLIYCMSAYALVILAAVLPGLPAQLRRLRAGVLDRSRLARRIAASALGGRYLNDLAFRGSVSIYQGMIVNFLYMLFRAVAGIRYASVWFISMAAYYLVLGGLRACLIWSYRRRAEQGIAFEYRCYRRTAWLLFLLNIPMGGMIVLMVRTNSGYSYPGHVIYLSALYTFYTMITSVINLKRFRKLGSPILSAAKVLNFVSAMMSILGLQTAMISRFSTNGEGYRRMMNAITGGFVYGIVMLAAVCMLVHAAHVRRKEQYNE